VFSFLVISWLAMLADPLIKNKWKDVVATDLEFVKISKPVEVVENKSKQKVRSRSC